MSAFYYDDRRRGRSSYNTTDDYYRRSSFPRLSYDGHDAVNGVSHSQPHSDHSHPSSRRNSNRDLVAYSPGLAREYTQTHAHSRSRSRPRQRSLSSSHLRGSDSGYRPRANSYSQHHHEHEHEQHHHHDGHHQHHHHDEHKPEHHAAKNAAATILGGIVGEQAAKHAHGNRLAEAAGVLVGAWGGHELEKGWERRERR